MFYHHFSELLIVCIVNLSSHLYCKLFCYNYVLFCLDERLFSVTAFSDNVSVLIDPSAREKECERKMYEK